MGSPRRRSAPATPHHTVRFSEQRTLSDTHHRPTRTRKRVAWHGVRTTGRIAPSQYGDHARWELFTITRSIGRALLVVEKHVHVLDAILEHASAPLYLVEEKLLLQTARDLQRDGAVIGRDALVDEELRDDARLERRLGPTGEKQRQIGTGK